MREETKQKRHEAISAAAYALLADKGYGGASMLAIAKAARASNETMYRWYGDKRGLFEQLARDNARDVRRALEEAIETGDAPMATLRRIAPILLTMLLGERAVLLNRAAAADETGELGRAVSAGGRDEIQPLIETLLTPIAEAAGLAPDVVRGWFVGLVISDQQIKRVIGVMPAPSAADVEAHCDAALASFEQLLARS